MVRTHEHLTSGAYPNCARLAGEFEASHKRVARDLEYMRDHFNLPIEYDNVRGEWRRGQCDEMPTEALTGVHSTAPVRLGIDFRLYLDFTASTNLSGPSKEPSSQLVHSN